MPKCTRRQHARPRIIIIPRRKRRRERQIQHLRLPTAGITNFRRMCARGVCFRQRVAGGEFIKDGGVARGVRIGVYYCYDGGSYYGCVEDHGLPVVDGRDARPGVARFPACLWC